MGFEILPIEDGEIDEVDPIYDVFEITGPKRWVPARFRSSETATGAEDNFNAGYNVSNVEELLGKEDYESLVGAQGPIEADDPTDFLTNYLEPAWHPDISYQVASTRKGYNTRLKPWHRVIYPQIDPEQLRKYLGWRPLDIVKATLEHTTQLAKTSIKYPLQRHFKSRNPFANVHRLNEVVSTDPLFANCKSLDNKFQGAQVFYGLKLHCIDVYGLKSKGEFPRIYKDFIREQGAPSALRRDNAQEEKSSEVLDIQRNLYVKDQFSEAYNPQQNPVEGRAIRWLKMASHTLLDRTGAPDAAWYFAIKYLADVHNITYDSTIGTTPYQMRHGITPDISAYLQHTFWEPIVYLDHEETWPTTKERPGRWVGIAHNIGDALTYWVYDEQSKRVLARSVVWPYRDNKRVKFDPSLDKQGSTHTAHSGGGY